MDPEEHKSHTGRAIEFQRKEWAAQRIGWAVMGLLVLLALAGLLGGGGPLADAEAAAADSSVRVRYLRLDHHLGPGELRVEIAPEFVSAGEVRLWVDRSYIDGLDLESIVPEPDQVQLEPDRVVYVFTVGEGRGPLNVSFSYRHEGYWRDRAELGLVNGEPVEFSQFVLP